MTTSPEVTPLPALEATYAVSADQAAQFQRDGHILLRSVATPDEVAAYRPAITATARRYDREERPLEQRDTYGKAFLQISNIWTHDEAVQRFVFARRFARIAAELLGVKAVRLYHDQALFKEPGGGPTPWHQDQYYWPLGTNNTITMWMPLVPLRQEMGTMNFASGSHTAGLMRHIAISDDSEAFYNKLVAEKGYPLVNYGAVQPGDATWHYGWTLHGAPGNATDTLREVMTIIYYADGTRLIEPDNPHRSNDLAGWFPGQKPGELAGSPLNPVLYQG